MQRKHDPIISVQIHPKILERIDCYSKDQYASRSETIRKILHNWCRSSSGQAQEPPVFHYQ